MIKSQLMKYRIREDIEETIEVWNRRIKHMKNYGLVNLISDFIITMYDKGCYEYEIKYGLMDKYGISEEQAEAALQ